MPEPPDRWRGYPVRWQGLLAVAGQEIAWVANDDRWLTPRGDAEEFQRLLALRPHLAKWHWLWVLADPDVARTALGQMGEAGDDRVQRAVRDAGWVLHALSWANWSSPTTLAMRDWFVGQLGVEVATALERRERFPANDRGRVAKSVLLLRVAVEHALEGEERCRWGTLPVDLGPLRPDDAGVVDTGSEGAPT